MGAKQINWENADTFIKGFPKKGKVSIEQPKLEIPKESMNVLEKGEVVEGFFDKETVRMLLIGGGVIVAVGLGLAAVNYYYKQQQEKEKKEKEDFKKKALDILDQKDNYIEQLLNEPNPKRIPLRRA